MKDLGRNIACWRPNLRGVGRDLAALLHINVADTVNTWLDPPVGVRDQGRNHEWASLAQRLPAARQIGAQIVFALRADVEKFGERELRQLWSRSYRAAGGTTGLAIAAADTTKFRVFGVVIESVNKTRVEVAG
jgi:hypothetical protein